MTKYVFKNPNQITKKMAGSTHFSFQDIIKKLMEDSYIEGLYKSSKALKIVATSSKPAKSKCKLMDLLNIVMKAMMVKSIMVLGAAVNMSKKRCTVTMTKRMSLWP